MLCQVAYIPSEISRLPKWRPGNHRKEEGFLDLIQESVFIDTDKREALIEGGAFLREAGKIIDYSGNFGYDLEITEKYRELVRVYISTNRFKDTDLILEDELERITNSRDDETIFLGENHLWQITQTINGDIIIFSQQYSDLRGKEKIQGELFLQSWVYIGDVPERTITIYQETTSLVANLLYYYKNHGGDIGKLETAMESVSQYGFIGCNATDSETKDDTFLKHMLLGNMLRNGSIYGGNQMYYETSLDTETGTINFWKHQDKNEGKELAISMSVADIPLFLSRLSILSGRSGDGPRKLIEWYTQGYTTWREKEI